MKVELRWRGRHLSIIISPSMPPPLFSGDGTAHPRCEHSHAGDACVHREQREHTHTVQCPNTTGTPGTTTLQLQTGCV